jgi:hypothetical protein
MEYNINNTLLKFENIKTDLLSKTKYSEEGIRNVLTSMASEFIYSKRDEFLIYVKRIDDVFYVKRKKLDDNEIIIELKDIFKSDVYINTGLVTENITRKTLLN